MASPAPCVAGWTWCAATAQSNLVVALFCAYVFFVLSRDLLSLDERAVAAAAALAGWQGCFLVCVLGRRRLPWMWPAARNTAVVLFGGWQLVFLCVRNSLDFWYTPIRDWCRKQEIWDHGVGPVLDPVNDAADQYANFNGIDQDWKMFTPPLARSDPFLAVRIVFTDGSDEVLLSDNEPDPRSFFRFGGWRQRRLEDVVVWGRSPVLSAAYVRWSVRRWRERRPDDPRTPRRVVAPPPRVELPGAGDRPRRLRSRGGFRHRRVPSQRETRAMSGAARLRRAASLSLAIPVRLLEPSRRRRAAGPVPHSYRSRHPAVAAHQSGSTPRPGSRAGRPLPRPRRGG